jgi:hypothetical protein
MEVALTGFVGRTFFSLLSGSFLPFFSGDAAATLPATADCGSFFIDRREMSGASSSLSSAPILAPA